ncbi:MAG TPA: helix-turn-helix domain-containing protein [Candidatus Onthousia faecavium]|nr:helix-turn-helix domain-containing protein [Candidatus Onthousia faecavium]
MKVYKFRLYPIDNQKVLINKTLGCVRFVYNLFLDY